MSECCCDKERSSNSSVVSEYEFGKLSNGYKLCELYISSAFLWRFLNLGRVDDKGTVPIMISASASNGNANPEGRSVTWDMNELEY